MPLSVVTKGLDIAGYTAGFDLALLIGLSALVFLGALGWLIKNVWRALS